MSLRLSPKHGVNPSLMTCFYCQEPSGVVLMGRLKNDAEAPHAITVDRTPCGTCAQWMAQGVILISVRDGEEGSNPWRTGGWVVLKDSAYDRMFDDPDRARRERYAFVEDSAWDMVGLPRVDLRAPGIFGGPQGGDEPEPRGLDDEPHGFGESDGF